ncbi:hypothetical protein GCK32_019797 [Trichostrongylus colubriformis]|uniref:Uncharacterized protein n=1 Tax=Trichostrongylus colubriformis TaxID=6319 RepID=A0AAN8FUV1_TRICO
MSFRRVPRSPRRRFRSCTTDLRRSENTLSCLLPQFELQVVHLFDQSQTLPPFFRALDNSYKPPALSCGKRRNW